jgi:hypothetical protein
VDNGDVEDTLVDAADPGCIANGVYVPEDDNETDPTLEDINISSNPELVRQGGASIITYQVNECLTTPGNVPALWQFKRDGAILATGTGTSNGEQAYPVTNIQAKTTFSISCGSTTRTTTVSLIKVKEF